MQRILAYHTFPVPFEITFYLAIRLIFNLFIFYFVCQHFLNWMSVKLYLLNVKANHWLFEFITSIFLTSSARFNITHINSIWNQPAVSQQYFLFHFLIYLLLFRNIYYIFPITFKLKSGRNISLQLIRKPSLCSERIYTHNTSKEYERCLLHFKLYLDNVLHSEPIRSFHKFHN
jgi:hypothetical protein